MIGIMLQDLGSKVNQSVGCFDLLCRFPEVEEDLVKMILSYCTSPVISQFTACFNAVDELCYDLVCRSDIKVISNCIEGDIIKELCTSEQNSKKGL